MSKTIIFVTSSNIHMYFLLSSVSIYPLEMLDIGPLTRVLCVKCFFGSLGIMYQEFFSLPCLYLYQTCDITFDFIIMLGIKPV